MATSLTLDAVYAEYPILLTKLTDNEKELLTACVTDGNPRNAKTIDQFNKQLLGKSNYMQYCHCEIWLTIRLIFDRKCRGTDNVDTLL